MSYGVPIATVREINRVSTITPVPETPKFVAGVMNLRGKVIPVVNLRLRFSLDAAANTRETCIIVIDAITGQAGVIVDSIKGVMDLSNSQIEPRPKMGSDAKLAFVIGMGKVEEQVIILVDVATVLAKDNLDSVTSQSSALAA
jgi:purine-binding chemotaxis protein CheW